MFFFAILVVSCLSGKAQEIPNGDFEVWDLYNTWTLEPQYWDTPNNQLIESVVQDTNAAQGELAMRVNVLAGFEGGVPQWAALSFLADTVATHLRYMVKTNIPDGDEFDRVSVGVELLISGNVIYTNVDTIYESIPEWELRYLPLPDSPSFFDGVRISVTSGYNNGLSGGSWDTWISIDDLRFESVVGLRNEHTETFNVYPNPSSHWVNFSVPENLWQLGIMVISDANGQPIFKGKLKQSIAVDRFPTGIYLASIFVEEQLVCAAKFVVQH